MAGHPGRITNCCETGDTRDACETPGVRRARSETKARAPFRNPTWPASPPMGDSLDFCDCFGAARDHVNEGHIAGV